MRIGKTNPPAAAPQGIVQILKGLLALISPSTAADHLKKSIEYYFSVKHSFYVSSGKTALTVILRALHNLQPQKTVVVIPAYTCYSVPASVSAAGLKVQLCDCGADSFDYNYEMLTAIVNEHAGSILCIVATHLFGIPCNLEKIQSLCTAHNIKMVEDAAQAMGVLTEKGLAGAVGDAGFFSLDRGKQFSTFEGGIIVTSDSRIAAAIDSEDKKLPVYSLPETVALIFKCLFLQMFIHPWLFWFPRMLPFLKLGQTTYDPGFPQRKINTFSTGSMLGFEKKLSRLAKTRIRYALLWKQYLTGAEDIILPSFAEKTVPLVRYPVIITNDKKRENLLRIADRLGWGIVKLYPGALTAIKELNAGDPLRFPNAVQLAQTMVTFPTNEYTTEHDIKEVTSYIKGII